MVKNTKLTALAERFYSSHNGWLVFCLVLAIAPSMVFAQKITAEMVLGDYRSDPLFGQARPEKTESIIIEKNRLIPEQISVKSGKTVRLLITNESQLPHLIVATDDVARVLANEAYINSFHDESAARLSPAGTHSHSSGSSVESASPIVRVAAEDPALYVSPGDSREMLIRVIPTEHLNLFCVLDGHHLNGFQTRIVIEDE